VAEDNEVNTLVITDMLEQFGCTYVHCEDGAQTVDAFGKEPFDVVLMDIQMPVMDGIKACQEIRRRWPNRKTRIYALTANAFEEERERAAAAGMDGFLTKPLRLADLGDVLRATIVPPFTEG
jgi:CheY-like chemotaxis protein